MMKTTSFIFLVTLVQLCATHFLLQYPTTIGYTDADQPVSPCGGYSATDRSAGVTSWPLGGNSIKVISTHSSVVWEFRAARASNPTAWVSLTPQLSQTGLGHFCEPQIPGYAPWVNQDAVLQIIQHTNHGDLYGVRRGPPPPKLESRFTLTPTRASVCRHQICLWRLCHASEHLHEQYKCLGYLAMRLWRPRTLRTSDFGTWHAWAQSRRLLEPMEDVTQ